MRVKVKSNAREREFVVFGPFTAKDEEVFFDVFLQVRRQSESQVVFNLAQCPRMDTAAMGMLLLACQEAAKRDLSRVIRGASDSLATQLKPCGFDHFYFFQQTA